MTLAGMAPQAEDVAVADLPLVCVDIRIQEPGLKVVWNHDQGGPFPHYLVNRAKVEHRGKIARENLAGLVAAARAKEHGRQFGSALKALARAGRELYNALFLDMEGTARDTVEAVRNELESRSTPCRILVKVDPRVHIPWGLLYGGRGRVEDLPDDGQIEGYQNFFCLKHNLATSYNRLLALPNPPAGSAFQLLSVIHKQTFEAARQTLPEGEQKVLDEMMRRHGGPIFSKAEFEQRWRAAAKFGLVYFYCHANGTTLALGAGDEIDHFTLSDGIEALPDIDKGICLFFLNGCATAVGSPQGGFLEATSSPKGFCGFIGTEAKVPDVFALRFGTAFQHLFLTSGLPIWRVMEKLRRQHWPLSLLYGVYGQPLVRLEPLVGTGLSPTQAGNFSEGVVGTKDMDGFSRG